MLRYAFILILSSSSLFAQTDMAPGFKMLEEGDFTQAQSFFTEVLDDLPENKTANICLGRAVGLGGDAPRALDIFMQTDKLYPDDFELLLNIGEAYLWNKQASESLDVYQSLIEREPTNYTANLGSANCHFKLQNYTEALHFIEVAISIDPENKSAVNSKKYILLALADEKKQGMDFMGSIDILDRILVTNALDQQALMNKAINYINLDKLKAAQACLTTLIDNGLENSELDLLLSHLSMLRHKDQSAIDYASKAMVLAKPRGKDLLLQSAIQKVNALGASKKFAEAHLLLDQLENLFVNKNEVKLARARMKVWGRDFEEGLGLYNQITDESYELHMGKTEAYMAMMKNDEALATVEQALLLNPNSFDAQKMKANILAKKKGALEMGGNSSSDDGGNEASEAYVTLSIPLGYKHTFHVHAGVRTTQNTLLNSSANQLQVFVGDRIQWNYKWSSSFSFGSISHQNELQKRLLNTIAHGTVKYQFTKNQALELAYNRKSLKYSSDLIKSGLIDDQFSANYQFVSPKKPGVFAQYSQSYLSDGNSSSSVFASAFYEINSFPVLKVGVNATYLTFQEDRAAVYFSPELYQMAELFVHFGNVYDTKAKISYSAMMALGKQSINQSSFENTRRIEVEVGYRFKSKYHLTVNYFTNTSAISNAKAYSFDRIGLKLVLPF